MLMEALNLPADFGLLSDYAYYRPVARVSLDQAVRMVNDAIKLARASQKKKMLVDVSGLTGFDSPPVSTRYFFIREWAAAAAGELCISFVARPEMIDPEKFGVTVARNAGMVCDVFASEAEAVDWLQQKCCV